MPENPDKIAERMEKCVVSLQNEMAKVRTGRATTGLLDHISVDYYGNPTPLSQVATITVADARTLTVTPWEKNMVPVVEKAIIGANLGLNPSTAGTVIRIPMPPLNEERRLQLIKMVKEEGEMAKVAVRNIRRDVIAQLKDENKAKELSDDELHREEAQVQKITDTYTGKIDSCLADKEKELLTI